MPTWNQLPDGGDWRNRNQSSLSTRPSSLSSANAIEHRLNQKPSTTFSSSSSSSANAAEYRLEQKPSNNVSSTNAVEHRLEQKPSPSKPKTASISVRSGDTLWGIAQTQLGDGDHWREFLKADGKPFTEQETRHLKIGTQVYLPQAKPRSVSRPTVSSANAVEHRLEQQRSRRIASGNTSSSSSANAAEYRLKQERSRQLASRRSSSSSSTNAAEYRTFFANTRPDLKPMPGSAADFRLAEERSKIYYQNNKHKIDAEVQQRIQQMQEEQPRLRLSPFEIKQDIGMGVLKAGWDTIRGLGSSAQGIYNLTLNPNPEVRRQTRERVGESVQSLVNNPAIQSINPIAAGVNFTLRPRETVQAFRDLGGTIAQPYVDAWKSGRPGEAIGRIFFDVISSFMPGGAATKAGTATRVATTGTRAEQVSSTINTADGARSGTSSTGSGIQPPTKPPNNRQNSSGGTSSTSDGIQPPTKPPNNRQGTSGGSQKPPNTGQRDRSNISPPTEPSTGQQDAPPKPKIEASSSTLEGNIPGRPLGAREKPVSLDRPNEFGTHREVASGRPYNPDNIGVPLADLSTAHLQIKPNGINRVEQHLSRFGYDPQNQAQIQRLRDIAAGKLKPTQEDLNFYAHELRESVHYRRLGYENRRTGQVWQPANSNEAYQVWNDAHTASLGDYSHVGDDLYHPSTQIGGEVERPLGSRGVRRDDGQGDRLPANASTTVPSHPLPTHQNSPDGSSPAPQTGGGGSGNQPPQPSPTGGGTQPFGDGGSTPMNAIALLPQNATPEDVAIFQRLLDRHPELASSSPRIDKDKILAAIEEFRSRDPEPSYNPFSRQPDLSDPSVNIRFPVRETPEKLRNSPGVATGGESLPDVTDRWFEDGRIGLIPGQIARQMQGREFKNFAKFRKTFWRLVAEDKHLGVKRSELNPNGWSKSNLRRMRRGNAPRVRSNQRTGSGANAVWQLDHSHDLQYGGGTYDLDNIRVVTPDFHDKYGR